MDSVNAYAKLQGKEDNWYITGLPFVFGRKSERHPEYFLDITMGAGTKTVSREHAVLTYSEDKVYAADSELMCRKRIFWR